MYRLEVSTEGGPTYGPTEFGVLTAMVLSI
jgi:hypothetical protein